MSRTSPKKYEDSSFGSYAVQDGKGDEVIWIHEQDGGGLHCEPCNLSACKHISSLIRDYEDTHVFDLEKVLVPVSVTHNMWILVEIESTDSSKASKGFTVHADEGLKPPASRLGFISPGEGRAILRSTIFAWLEFENLSGLLNFKCELKTHGYKAEMNLSQDIETKRVGWYLQAWSFKKLKCCRDCSVWVGDDGYDDDESLFPEDPSGYKRVTGVSRSARSRLEAREAKIAKVKEMRERGSDFKEKGKKFPLPFDPDRKLVSDSTRGSTFLSEDMSYHATAPTVDVKAVVEYLRKQPKS